MKRTLGLGLAIAVLLLAAALSRSDRPAPGGAGGDLQVATEDRNPWTHLKLNNGPDSFQFAIVSDRTGGHRGKIFSQAVERLNLIQPEFVLSVGDLIEGYSEDKDKVAAEWKEFDGYVAQLQMPFFYVPGNHDISNVAMDKTWKERYGRRYYHFVYRNVLFLLLNSEDPPSRSNSNISEEQIAFVEKTLQANRGVRWTIVALHKPMWVFDNGEKNGWRAVEKLLEGRRYTVFAGHVHRYHKFVRQGMSYYQLATTGGGSKLRGLDYGEFDHLVWVTMKKEGPVLANVMLEGIFSENLAIADSKEEGVKRKLRDTHLVTGRVRYQDKSVSHGVVALWTHNAKTKRYARASDAMTERDGSFALSTYKAFDGAPAGDYVVTITWQEPRFDAEGKPTPNKLPERYSRPETTPLKTTVGPGSNRLEFELTN